VIPALAGYENRGCNILLMALTSALPYVVDDPIRKLRSWSEERRLLGRFRRSPGSRNGPL